VLFEKMIRGLDQSVLLTAFGFRASELYAIDLSLLRGLILRRAFPDPFQVHHVTHCRLLPIVAFADAASPA
jgi:hypothetical protein